MCKLIILSLVVLNSLTFAQLLDGGVRKKINYYP